MTDIDGAYNTDLLGLLHSARKHGALAYTGTSTLSDIVNAVGDYGHLPTLIEQVRKDFNDFKYKIQTPDSSVSQTMDKLVNIWLLQQDLLSGNKFDDFIVINFTIIKGKPYFDVHPGRTRLYFHNSYFDRVKVLFLDQEAEWQGTIDQVRYSMQRKEVEPYWFQIPFVIQNGTSTLDWWLK